MTTNKKQTTGKQLRKQWEEKLAGLLITMNGADAVTKEAAKAIRKSAKLMAGIKAKKVKTPKKAAVVATPKPPVKRTRKTAAQPA